ncbi:SDR family NAD(P)-dependent oxidoreductase [Nocardia vinacea]|uniref:SDR family NAD(P)-dependent oxidoreductase n=1 Tax=Nocardia vinacea TaxID=96468 RepID=UPI003F4D7DD1
MSDNDIDRMVDRTVLITGATDGLGRELAVRLGAAGARLILHGRNPDRAAAVAAEVTTASGAVSEIILADLSRLAEVDRLADEIIARTSRLDVLVNNAGTGGRPNGRRELSADGNELLWAVNPRGPQHPHPRDGRRRDRRVDQCRLPDPRRALDQDPAALVGSVDQHTQNLQLGFSSEQWHGTRPLPPQTVCGPCFDPTEAGRIRFAGQTLMRPRSQLRRCGRRRRPGRCRG